jgi:hypothetical protein
MELPETVLWADLGLNSWEIENEIGLGLKSVPRRRLEDHRD